MLLQTLEQYWLVKSPFLAGDDISIADLLYCCELDQLCLLDGAEQVSMSCQSLHPDHYAELLTGFCKHEHGTIPACRLMIT